MCLDVWRGVQAGRPRTCTVTRAVTTACTNMLVGTSDDTKKLLPATLTSLMGAAGSAGHRQLDGARERARNAWHTVTVLLSDVETALKSAPFSVTWVD